MLAVKFKPAILTRRQVQLLQLVADGYSNKEIAEQLSLAHQTVKNTLFRAMRRLGVSNKAHAVAVAIGCGLIQVGGENFARLEQRSPAPPPHMGGNEMTLITMFIPMYHHGMIVVTSGYGDPAVFEAGSPYGASSVSGPMSDRPPTENDLKVARYLGRRVAQVAKALSSEKT